ncbi:MAG: hypothetical protein ACI8S6_001509 [Myxococcota bacterium]|jgi:hypothetical protein
MLLALLQSAHACTCGLPTVPEALARADAVFRATVVSVERGSHPMLSSSTTTMVVREVWKGEVASRVSLGSGGWCGIESLPEDTEWVVFATRTDNGSLVINACSGTEEVGKPLGAIPAAIFGGPPPVPAHEQLGEGRQPRR